VNVLSIAAREAFPGNAAYCASTGGALGFTRVLAQEARIQRVRVTAVLPGATDTAIWDEIDWTPDRSRMLRPDDVARAILSALTAPPSASVDEIGPPGLLRKSSRQAFCQASGVPAEADSSASGVPSAPRPRIAPKPRGLTPVNPGLDIECEVSAHSPDTTVAGRRAPDSLRGGRKQARAR
jgi:hypothetical protein